MDEYSSRRAAGGLVISRKGPSLVLRDSVENNRDRNNNVQVCSRVGCSSKMSTAAKGTQMGFHGKGKASKTSFRSSANSKEIIGSSSKTPTAVNSNNSRKPFSGSKKKGISETSSLQDEFEEVSDSTPTSGKTQMRVHPEPDDHDLGGSSSSGPNTRFLKRNTQKFGLGRQDNAASSSSAAASIASRNGASNTNKYNLRNLKCNSISDVVQSGCSSPSSSSSPEASRRRDTGRKRIGEPESSLSARGKKINGPMLDERRNENPNRGISISDSRRTRNMGPAAGENEGSSSIRARRSNASRTRLSNQENRSRLPLVESPQLPDLSLDASSFGSENQFTVQTPSNRSSSFSRPGGSSDHTRPNRSVGPYDVGIARSFMNRDTLRQFNLDGIAEMLLALERIEQEEEPSYEQLLVLETNLFLGGLAFHDQHRDMRLDIDNMSYEELLALEERMGTVSTAVPEEALAKCLMRSIYQGTMDCREDENEDDVKCSICQEEYVVGNEVGRLGCDHRYHVECIHQWLRLKNWCPICKSSATTPTPSTS